MLRPYLTLIRTAHGTLSRTLHVDSRVDLRNLLNAKFKSIRVASQTVSRFYHIPQRKVDFLGMQPVTEADSVAGKHETGMECDGDALNVQLRKDISPDTKDSNTEGEKVKTAKRKMKKPRARKERVRSSESTDSLMAELPFANTKIWKELGFTTSESSLKKKRKRGESGRVESEEDGEKKKKKKKESYRPNYFVSIPITNQKIKESVEAVQALVVQKDPRMTPALIPVGSLHITLLVTYLGTEEEVNLASCAVGEMKPTIQSLLKDTELVLPFTGISHFKNEVAFIQLAEGEHLTTLTQIAEAVRKTFEENGIPSGDAKAFKPHLTFMKLSRAKKLRSQGIKKLDPDLYSEYAKYPFGEERVCRLDLCSMLKKKTPDGYYHREKSVTFGAKRAPEPDDEELLSLSKRLVEDAVLRAVQQYMEETQQNGGPPKDQGPPSRPAGDLNNASVSK
ncbi:A-kinase anchor protein 7 [Chanos chanos]|uniref:A-kinase anchor protein 7 n=1 Tax=Chanos chanos TaxID=29144 RepID=A0A6J2VZG8_CHACN|nr:A-kinase anchoring protein 7 [Chanos chanos]